MRTPRHEAVAAHSARSAAPATTGRGRGDASDADAGEMDGGGGGDDGDGDGGDGPIRRCILVGERAPRAALVRLALSPGGDVLPDVRAKAPGRGAWIGVDSAALRIALDKGRLKAALARAFRTGSGKTSSGATGTLTIPADLPERIAAALERAALERIGLELRAGHVVTGAERLDAAARAGGLELLLHASDAGADGVRRLDQAWRVGRGVQGSDLRGLALPASRTILAVALGRANVVHLGVTEPGAARRALAAVDRWRRFVGPDPRPHPRGGSTEPDALAPCETASQGASASPPAPARDDPIDPAATTSDAPRRANMLPTKDFE